jgi:hypothetical protein
LQTEALAFGRFHVGRALGMEISSPPELRSGRSSIEED